MQEKLVYSFTEGNKGMKELLGGKGANLAEMTSLGLPVPPGFIVTTKACTLYYEVGEQLSHETKEAIKKQLKELEALSGKTFGDSEDPLLLSVRSGAVFSMPGMMDTVLNLGLNDVSVEGLSRRTSDPRFAYDCYRRFIQMFGDVVLKVEHKLFSDALEAMKDRLGIADDSHIPAADVKSLVEEFKAIIQNEKGMDFPQDPMEQLMMSVEAVFKSWNNKRARVYRDAHGLPHDLGTAVNVQVMVFGNTGEQSGTGVLFTRNPSTGEKELYGEFLVNAQGEDVVAGTRTPLPIKELDQMFPGKYQEILEKTTSLEKNYQDMQDIEFTIEKDRLFLLQTRTGKRTAEAAIKIAVEMTEEGLIDKDTALLRVDAGQIETILHPQVDMEKNPEIIATGLPASPGAARGVICFSADRAQEEAEAGSHVLLVSPETTPDDIHGILAARGVLTTRGGMTSHAAVVARGMGKPCVCGCESIRLDMEKETLTVDGVSLKAGDILTINGSSGDVIIGEVTMKDPRLTPEALRLLQWVDEKRVLKVRTNADNGPDAARAREYGAEGIGLCRTEHMFMGRDRLPLVQRIILSKDAKVQKQALKELLKMQQEDFVEIFKAMDGLPVTIRLLDPPLHEFLPDLLHLKEEILQLEHTAHQEGLAQKEELFQQVQAMSEANPMLGLRGCRLGLIRPDIYQMQVTAIIRAALMLKDQGLRVIPEIMIPLVSHTREFSLIRERAEKIIQEEMKKSGLELEYLIGTMIELPRACLTAEEIGGVADFFSFGTNDLTQTTFGFSRDDAEAKFLHIYLDQEILEKNPFIALDQEGVGRLVQMGTVEGRKGNPNLKVGICGEHGGEPSSVEFFHQTGLDYVSCSPFRVPVARLAAAQAVIREEQK